MNKIIWYIKVGLLKFLQMLTNNPDKVLRLQEEINILIDKINSSMEGK